MDKTVAWRAGDCRLQSCQLPMLGLKKKFSARRKNAQTYILVGLRLLLQETVEREGETKKKTIFCHAKKNENKIFVFLLGLKKTKIWEKDKC